ncbi:MAG: DUF4190 domain-containing protein [Ilumatobacteraceae bacterium]
MSTPPPPPPGQNPPPFQPGQPAGFQQGGYQPPPSYQAPPGYQQFGGVPAGPQKTNGLSIASLVLSLVNIIPCFWAFPIPALLGVIFGFVGRKQISNNPQAKGKGLATAGLIIGLVFLVIAVIFWVYVSTSDNCYRDGSTFRCV